MKSEKPPENDKGRRAYEDRARTGAPWGVVALRHGISSSESAINGAKKYAKTRKLVWPVKSRASRQRKEAAALRATRQALEDESVYLFIKGGGGYFDCQGRSSPQVYAALERHCANTGDPALPNNGQRAYESYKDTGMTWKQVGDTLGYTHSSNAQEAAATYAREKGLTWPLHKRSSGLRPPLQG